MSSAPPPPPPFAPGPADTGTTPWTRQAVRDQRRSADLAAKQQKAALRAQTRATRRRSLLFPLLLISLGLLFLLVQLGRIPWTSALLWLGTWWPAILVASGLVLIAEWAYDTATTGAEASLRTPRRSIGAGAVTLLVILACVGASAAGWNNHPGWIEQNWSSETLAPWGLAQMFAQKSETQHELSAPLAAGAVLTIRNYKGNITVTGTSQDGQVHVSAHQKTWAWQSSELRSREQRNLPSLERDGGNLLVAVKGEGADESDLTIEIPHDAALQIDPEHGDVSVSELRGSVAVASHTGNINLTAVTGHISLSSNDDDATVSGHSLSGDITLDGRSGDLAFSDVTGPLNLHGDFFGNTHLERIAGPVHFQSSFTDFACAGLPGELNVEGRNDLEARDLSGPVVLKTSDRNLTLSGVKGETTVSNEKGSVTLSLATPIAPVQVSTTDGSITLQMPEKASFNLDAETSDGDINTNLGLTPHKSEDRTTLAGKVLSGGPAVKLRTTDGDVGIHSGAARADGTAAPSSPDDDDEGPAEKTSL